MKQLISILLLTTSIGFTNPVDAKQHHSVGVSASDKKPKKVKKKSSGIASWYGEKHHGRKTASGEIFDMYKLTAASKTIPLGTEIKVTNIKTGQSVVATVTDRGPYAGNRILDLSFAAAKRIGMIKTGTAKIIIEII